MTNVMLDKTEGEGTSSSFFSASYSLFAHNMAFLRLNFLTVTVNVVKELDGDSIIMRHTALQ